MTTPRRDRPPLAAVHSSRGLDGSPTTEDTSEPSPDRRARGPPPPVEALHDTLIADLSILADIIHDSSGQVRPILLLDPFVVQPVVVARVDSPVPELESDLELLVDRVVGPREHAVELSVARFDSAQVARLLGLSRCLKTRQETLPQLVVSHRTSDV